MPRIGDVPQLVTAAAADFWVAIQKRPDRPPLPEITLIRESGQKTVMVMQGRTLDEAIELSNKTAARLSQTVAVCIEVRDGYVTRDGRRTDAILVNAWVEGRGPIFFARCYRRDPFELLDTVGPYVAKPSEPTPPPPSTGDAR